MKNNLGKCLFLAVALFASSCANSEEPELNSKLNSPEHHAQFIKLLEEENIPHRVESDDSVFYPASEKEKVSKIFRSVLGVTAPEVKSVRVGAGQAPDVAARLVKAQISFEVIHQENTSLFTWPTHLNDKALKIVREVLREHGV